MDDEQKTPDGWDKYIDYRKIGFDVNDDGVLLHYIGSEKVVDIPAGIKEIDDYAFKGCKVTSVTVPNSVKRIGAFAFYRCESLTEITIASSVERIAPYAFLECSSLSKVTYHGSIGAWRRINDWKGTIGEYTLDCTGSSTGVFSKPETEAPTLEISEEGEILNAPEKIEEKDTVLKRAYRKLPFVLWGISLALLVIGAILMVVFSNFDDVHFFVYKPLVLVVPLLISVVSVVVGVLLFRSGDRDWKRSVKGVLMIVSLCVVALSFLGSLSFLFLPKPSYADGASYEFFYKIKEDNTITLVARASRFYPTEAEIPSEIDGYTVTSIGSSAFYECGDLTSVTIPNSVTNIGSSAFEGCSGLTSVTIPNSVTSIGASAFAYCRGLTSVTIPDRVTSIGRYAFSGCSGLTTINVAEGNPTYHSAGNCLIETSSKTLIAGCRASVIPSDGSVTRIGEDAFRGCTGLTSVTIPNSVTNIGQAAFYYCSGLTSITFEGTGAQWRAISKGNWWDDMTGNYTIHCTDGDIAK